MRAAAAPVELGVEPVDVDRRHPAQRHLAPPEPEVALDDTDSLPKGARRPAWARTPRRSGLELAHGADRPPDAVGHLDDQPVEGSLGLALGAAEGAADLLPLAGEGVAAGVRDQLPAAASLPQVPGRHLGIPPRRGGIAYEE